MLKYIIYLLFIVFVSACNSNSGSHGHSHDTIGAESNHETHGHEESVLSYTLFNEGYELFVEFTPLIVGYNSNFAAHFTRLADYKPLTQGEVTVSIIKDKKGIRNKVDNPSCPGIFRPKLNPVESGLFKMIFELKTDGKIVVFDLGKIEVFSNKESVKIIEDKNVDDEISFLKEQAWKTDFATMIVKPKEHHAVIQTAGKVKNHPQMSHTVSAQADGRLKLMALSGKSVRKGELVAIIQSAGIDSDISVKFEESKIGFEKTKTDYLRTKSLVESGAISKKDFNTMISAYSQDSIRYFQMKGLVSQGNVNIYAPSDGFITDIIVKNGSMVNEGDDLLKITVNKSFLIETYISSSYAGISKGIFDALFKIPSNGKTFTLDDLAGKLITENFYIQDGSTRMPCNFLVAGSENLFQGQFLEAFLYTDKKDSALVIPISAIIEEQGKHFVYVQTGGESFVKREISFVNNDGQNVEIVNGLKSDERIVSKGVYPIKLSSMSGDLPLHGHTH